MAALAGETEQVEKLQERIAALEQHVVTLSVAVDAASRLRLSPVVLHPDVRIAGGRAVRRVLERGGLVHGYPEMPSAG
jgi:hypothetical protein